MRAQQPAVAEYPPILICSYLARVYSIALGCQIVAAM